MSHNWSGINLGRHCNVQKTLKQIIGLMSVARNKCDLPHESQSYKYMDTHFLKHRNNTKYLNPWVQDLRLQFIMVTS